MATQEKDQMCDILVQKMTVGDPLDLAEKSHLASCQDCMSRVVRALDGAALSESRGPSMAVGGTNGDRRHARPEAEKALAHGRKVFEREFGISLSGETGRPESFQTKGS